MKLLKKWKPAVWALAAAFLVASVPWFLWMLEPAKPLDVIILDKTVPDESFREHKGLIWLLNQQKYVKSADKSPYDYKRDYYGLKPRSGTYDWVELPEPMPKADLLYIADTYGRYDGDASSDDAAIGSGGLTDADLERIRSSVYRGTSLIAEFNTFADPTPPQVRKQMGELLGLRWSGWIGRYFSNLEPSVEIPPWLTESYTKQYGETWPFQGPGVVLVGQDNKVIVLEEGKELAKRGFWFTFTAEGRKMTGVNGQRLYPYWFDIVEPSDGTEVLAHYKLDVTEEGAEALLSAGIPALFPAVVAHTNSIYTSYYFAGDYVDVDQYPIWGRYKWWEVLKSWATLGNDEDAFFWDVYVPMMKSILSQLSGRSAFEPAPREVDSSSGVSMVSRTEGKRLQVFKEGSWRDFFVKGMNMGMALPGKWFTEFPKDQGVYLRWFEQIGAMGANTIRVYTLMDPTFYEAFLLYNQRNAQAPLWLLQEMWPEEHPDGLDYLQADYDAAFVAEIRNVVDAIHGNANIGKRQGRAYGAYRSDVSPYVLGYLVGRELEPDEVEATDRLNAGFSYTGSYVSIGPNGSPTEAWLAKNSDELLAYEEETYGWQHPVAIVSWPTLDPLDHETEWGSEAARHTAYNDKSTIDIRHFVMGTRMKAGFFGAYHIYPNYPDFMNNEPAYDSYSDDEGRLRYGAYLRDFMEMHGDYPALVAEFGLATGTGNAHANPDGYHHGGLTEEEQGEGIVRMMKAIRSEGFAGGVVFEWMDEWAKKTWITEPFMIPYERKVLWHNAIDPEQNYGILAIESIKPSVPQFRAEGIGPVSELAMSADETFLYLDVTANDPIAWERQDWLVGLDTYDRERGEFHYDSEPSITFTSGMEFLLRINDPEEAKLFAAPSYNIARSGYASAASKSGRYEEIRRQINKEYKSKSGLVIPAQYEDGSTLRYGAFDQPDHYVFAEGNRLHIRIPWGRINVTDPTSRQVLDDPSFDAGMEPARDELRTTTTDGLVVSIALKDEATGAIVPAFPGNIDRPYMWELGPEPNYRERLKASYPIIQNYFETIP